MPVLQAQDGANQVFLHDLSHQLKHSHCHGLLHQCWEDFSPQHLIYNMIKLALSYYDKTDFHLYYIIHTCLVELENGFEVKNKDCIPEQHPEIIR